MTVVITETQTYGNVPYGSVNYASGVASGASGIQFFVSVRSEGIQYEPQIVDFENPQGIQYFATNLGFVCPTGYGTGPYGSMTYGGGPIFCIASAGVEFEPQIVDFTNPQGIQYEGQIVDIADAQGIQFLTPITDFPDPEGIQYEGKIVGFINPQGIQYESQIVDTADPEGIQFAGQVVDHAHPEGIQYDSRRKNSQAIQYLVNLYNAKLLRVMCSFPSRGLASGSGTNAWLEDIATGKNWRTNSQDPATDRTVFNLNSDIVEQTFRTLVNTSVTIDCDAETNAGISTDTIAIMNHNLTTSATVTVIGSVNPSFTPIAKTIVMTPKLRNMFHIEALLPPNNEVVRYWRFQISDPTNTNSFLEIGTIIFGPASIFQPDECMNQHIFKHPFAFADTFKTEGFTAFKNNRSLKNKITLTFNDLQFNEGNFSILDDVFETARTSLKCLWIPTPNPTDPAITARFAVFGKIPVLPSQDHNVVGSVNSDQDFVSVRFDVDEAE